MTKMEEKVIEKGTILVVARPNRWRDALCALLATAPGMDVVGPVQDVSSALRFINEHPPALVLLDACLSDGEIEAMLKQIKTNNSPTRCIYLADNARQQQTARLAGADDVLLKGRLTANLLAAVERFTCI